MNRRIINIKNITLILFGIAGITLVYTRFVGSSDLQNLVSWQPDASKLQVFAEGEDVDLKNIRIKTGDYSFEFFGNYEQETVETIEDDIAVTTQVYYGNNGTYSGYLIAAKSGPLTAERGGLLSVALSEHYYKELYRIDAKKVERKIETFRPKGQGGDVEIYRVTSLDNDDLATQIATTQELGGYVFTWIISSKSDDFTSLTNSLEVF